MSNTRWSVTFYNQHTCDSIMGEGRTRRAAFDAAFKRCPPYVRHTVLADRVAQGSARGMDVTWLATFNDLVAYMRRGATSATHTDPRGFALEVRRVRDASHRWL